MKTLKIIGNCCLVFLAVIALFISIAYIYYRFFIKDKTVGVNYISDQLAVDVIKSDDLSEEEKSKYDERWFMEINYFSNSKKNGIMLQELNFNYFTDYTLTSDKYRATGMQYVGDYKHTPVRVSTESELNNYVFPAFTYYDTWDGISYNGYYGSYASLNCLLKRSTSFTIKLDNRAFEIQLDKFWTRESGWWIFKSAESYYYTWSDLFESAMKSVVSANVGYGDYYLEMDFSQFFTIKEYDLKSGKLKEDDVTNIIKTYALVKVHYDENGAKNSTQSLFGSIECNPKYDVEDTKIDTTYWQERMVYNLTVKDFTYRYSDVYKGYFASLNLDLKKMFAEMPRSKVNISFNLQSQYLIDKKINVIGFDYNGLEDFEIDTLTIVGKSQTFYLLEKSLYNTNLQTLKYSSGITLDFSENATNNEYVGVVL